MQVVDRIRAFFLEVVDAIPAHLQHLRLARFALGVALAAGSLVAPRTEHVDAELSEEWRQRDRDRYAVARGDFDGDGKPDVARLMLSRDGKKAAVVISLSASGVKIIELHEDAAFVLGIMAVCSGVGVEFRRLASETPRSVAPGYAGETSV